MEPEEDKLITSYSLPTVVFGPRTEMNETVKENLLYSVFVAEREYNVTMNYKLKQVANRMESFYGGDWSLHMGRKTIIGGTQAFELGYFAEFTFNGYSWIIYKNKCD